MSRLLPGQTEKFHERAKDTLYVGRDVNVRPPEPTAHRCDARYSGYCSWLECRISEVKVLPPACQMLTCFRKDRGNVTVLDIVRMEEDIPNAQACLKTVRAVATKNVFPYPKHCYKEF